MTTLHVYDERGNLQAEPVIDYQDIADLLREHGVTLERWQAGATLSEDATQEEVIGAYQSAIDELGKTYGIKSMDVVALRPDNPKKDEMRQMFLAEHTHDDFEVRFFVEGSGIFYLHLGERVYAVHCHQGDLISVPANTTHWFDMGKEPNFKCIRLFTVENGWVGNFTGSDIATRVPDFEAVVQSTP